MSAFDTTTFTVHILRITGSRLGGTDKPRDTYVSMDFDSYKTHKTAPKPKTSEPVWEEGIPEFTYTTRQPGRLGVKEVVFDVFEKNTYTKDTLLGTGRVDLYTIMTGPRALHIALSGSDHSDRGALFVEMEVVQVTNTGFSLLDVEVVVAEAVDAADACVVQAELTVKSSMAGSSQLVRATPNRFTLAELRVSPAATTIYELFYSAVQITVTAGATVATATLPVYHWYSFSHGATLPFDVDLVTSYGAVVGAITGNLRYTDFPVWVQMPGGQRMANNHITGGVMYHTDLPKRPTIPVEIDRSKHGGTFLRSGQRPDACKYDVPTRTFGAASGGATSAPAPPPAAAPSPTTTAHPPSLSHYASVPIAGASGGAGASSAHAMSMSRAISSPLPSYHTTSSSHTEHAFPTTAPAVVPAPTPAPAPAPTSPTPRDLAAAQLPALSAQASDLYGRTSTLDGTVHAIRVRQAEIEHGGAMNIRGLEAQVLGAEAEMAEHGRQVEEARTRLAGGAQSGTTLHTALTRWRDAEAAAADRIRDFVAALRSYVDGMKADVKALGEVASRREVAVAEVKQQAWHALKAVEDCADGSHVPDLVSLVPVLAAGIGDANRALGEEMVLQELENTAAKARTAGVSHAWAPVEAAQAEAGVAVTAAVAAREDAAAAIKAEEEAVATAAAAAAAKVAAEAAAARPARTSSVSASFVGLDPSMYLTGGAMAGGMGPITPTDGRSRSGSGATVTVHLPACWRRCTDPTSGRVYFQNEETKTTVWDLPTVMEYEVTWTQPSPLGIRLLEKDVAGPGGYPAKSVEVMEGSAPIMAMGGEHIAPGHVVLSVNGMPARGRTLADVLAMVSSAGRPITIRFMNPHAVSGEVAARAKDPSAVIKPMGPGGAGGPMGLTGAMAGAMAMPLNTLHAVASNAIGGTIAGVSSSLAGLGLGGMLPHAMSASAHPSHPFPTGYPPRPGAYPSSGGFPPGMFPGYPPAGGYYK